MAGLFRTRRSSESAESSDVPHNPETTPVPAVPAAAMSLLEEGLQKWRDDWARVVMGGSRAAQSGARLLIRENQDAVKRLTLQTLTEWFTIEDEHLGENSPGCFVMGSYDTPNMTTKGLCLADVTNWIYHWDREATGASHNFDAIPHNLDGAEQHRQRVVELRRLKQEEEDRPRKERADEEFHRMLNRLSAIAKSPISYTPDDTVPAADEQSMYAEFADQLRQGGLDESAVFDSVAELSKLVQESRAILPKLTLDAAKQFEARIMLDFYRARQTAINQYLISQQREIDRWESVQAARDSADAARDAAEAVSEVSSRLATLNSTASGQASDVRVIKWVDMIDSLFGH